MAGTNAIINDIERLPGRIKIIAFSHARTLPMYGISYVSDRLVEIFTSWTRISDGGILGDDLVYPLPLRSL